MAVLVEAAPAALLNAITVLSLVFPLVIVVNLLFRLTSNASLPPNLPWAGMGSSSGPYSRLRANWTSILNLKSLINEGYSKVGHPIAKHELAANNAVVLQAWTSIRAPTDPHWA